MAMRLNVNGTPRKIEAPPETPLLWALRDDLGLTGTKYGCGRGACGACTVHLEGSAVRSCVLPIGSIGQRRVTTIESAADPRVEVLRQAWIEHDVAQCGYCQPGQIMSAAALLARHPNPTDAQIDEAMSGNICRCGTYERIRRAIHAAAARR